jgi:hypothetical protein
MRMAAMSGLAILLAACNVTLATPRTHIEENPSLSEPPSGMMTILNTSSYEDGYGAFHVIGELRNDDHAARQNILLRIAIRDSSGKSVLTDPENHGIESEIFGPYLDVLFPGQVTGFEYTLAAQAGTPASFNVRYVASKPSRAVPGNVHMDNAQFLNDSHGFSYVVGELVNSELFPVTIVGLAGAVLDQEGSLVSSSPTLNMVKYLAPAGALDGQDRAPFMISMYGSFAAGTPWKTYISAIQCNPLPQTHVEISVANRYVDTYGYYHIVGTLQNQGTEQLSLRLLGGLFASDGKVLDANSYSLPIDLDAGTSQPFDLYDWTLVNRDPEKQQRIDHFSIQIDPGWVSSRSMEHVLLPALDVSEKKAERGTWYFQGAVKNDSAKTLDYMVVFISIVNEHGSLVAANQQALYPEELWFIQGETTSFKTEVDLDPLANSVDLHYSIKILGAVTADEPQLR